MVEYSVRRVAGRFRTRAPTSSRWWAGTTSDVTTGPLIRNSVRQRGRSSHDKARQAASGELGQHPRHRPGRSSRGSVRPQARRSMTRHDPRPGGALAQLPTSPPTQFVSRFGTPAGRSIYDTGTTKSGPWSSTTPDVTTHAPAFAIRPPAGRSAWRGHRRAAGGGWWAGTTPRVT